MASQIPFARALVSSSVDDIAMLFWFLDADEIGFPAALNTQPVIDLLSILQFAQFESVNPKIAVLCYRS